jgi:integrase
VNPPDENPLKDSNDSIPANTAGGPKEKWKNILKKSGQTLESPISPVDGEDMVTSEYEIKKTFNGEVFKNPYILDPGDYKTKEDLFDALRHWWIFRYRKGEKTIKDRIRYARNMSEHPLFPVDWLNLNPNQVIAYLEYKEYHEYENGRGKHQIRNEWKTVKTIAKAFGVDAEIWGYIPPNPPSAKVRIIPLPHQVHAIVHRQYSTDKYTNALYQYILMHGFLLGFRPSELVIQKVSDVHIEDGYMIITETKKRSQERQVFPEKQLLSGHQYKSFKNWIDSWRPQVANQYSGDFLYLQPNGRPYTVNYLRKVLAPSVKEIWSQYSLYTMRHWCAIARLIKDYVDRGTWDKTDIQDWLGHEKVGTTDQYTKFAKKYYLNAQYDWIKAILKYHAKRMVGVNGKKSINPQKGPVSNRFTGENVYAPVGIRTRVEASKGPHDWPLHHRSIVYVFK